MYMFVLVVLQRTSNKMFVLMPATKKTDYLDASTAKVFRDLKDLKEILLHTGMGIYPWMSISGGKAS